MKKIRLLIVDDHPMVRDGLRSILQDEPEFKVVGEAGHGGKALELVEKLRPDIMLLDLKLPGMGGIEVCRRVSATSPHTAVVALTTFADEKLAQECIQCRARGYVLKDIERLQLKQILRTVASGESVIDPKVVDHMVRHIHPAPNGTHSPTCRDDLSDQQLNLLRLISQGFSNKEIGGQMSLSENTVKSYVQELFQKIGVHNRVEAAMIASKRGWI